MEGTREESIMWFGNLRKDLENSNKEAPGDEIPGLLRHSPKFFGNIGTTSKRFFPRLSYSEKPRQQWRGFLFY